jgi:hypothetical protein
MLNFGKSVFKRKKTDESLVKVGDMEESIRVKLSVKPDSKVCLFHARKDVLPQFMKGDLKLMLDWAENDCDSIIYWVRPQDDMKDITLHLEKQIKPSGRIWVVVQNGKGPAKGNIELIQQEVTDYTNLLKGKVVAIGDGESAIQFVLRKDAESPGNKNMRKRPGDGTIC